MGRKVGVKVKDYHCKEDSKVLAWVALSSSPSKHVQLRNRLGLT